MGNIQREEEEEEEADDNDEEPMDVEDDPALLDNMNKNNDDRPNNDLMDGDPLMDADLNIAPDELLGARGLPWVVVRNLSWLLATLFIWPGLPLCQGYSDPWLFLSGAATTI